MLFPKISVSLRLQWGHSKWKITNPRTTKPAFAPNTMLSTDCQQQDCPCPEEGIPAQDSPPSSQAPAGTHALPQPLQRKAAQRHFRPGLQTEPGTNAWAKLRGSESQCSEQELFLKESSATNNRISQLGYKFNTLNPVSLPVETSSAISSVCCLDWTVKTLLGSTMACWELRPVCFKDEIRKITHLFPETEHERTISPLPLQQSKALWVSVLDEREKEEDLKQAVQLGCWNAHKHAGRTGWFPGS